MLIPFPIVIPSGSTSLEERVRRLEQALALTLNALQSVVERLGDKYGKEFLGTELQQLTTTESGADLEDIVDGIDSSLKGGEKPTAVRQLRDLFGCTWDEAHQAIGQWRYHSREQKLRWLRLARYIKKLESAGDSQNGSSNTT